MRVGLLIALLPSLVQWSAPCSAQSQGPKVGNQASALTPDEIEQLIDALAARNPKPPSESNELAPYEAQIWKAVDALNAQGIRAFPLLISHFDDDRFCCCEDSLASRDTYHRSVGYVCHIIVERQVHKYARWDVRDPRGTPGHAWISVPKGKKDAQTWQVSNLNKRLWELQADTVRRVIRENQERLVSETDAQNRKLCEDAIKANEKLLSDVTKRKTSIPTEPFRPYIGR